MSQLMLPRVFPFDDPAMPYRIEWMDVSDLGQVIRIERAVFPAPWPASAYRYELTQNDLSVYLVLRLRQRMLPTRRMRSARPTVALGRVTRLWKGGRKLILGYGGFWSILDEAHVSTIAVHPDWRRRGLGEMMLVALIDAALLCEATEVTLEVRASNEVAQSLYCKYAFVEVGRRQRYYHDNNEDALIMTLSGVDSSVFQARYADLKAELRPTLVQRSAWPARDLRDRGQQSR